MKKLLFLITMLLSISANAEDKPMEPKPNTEYATFAGGCFWCMQPVFDNIPGVIKTTVGYSGGTAADADYETVSTGKTEHKEAIQIEYDPGKVTFHTLLEKFMRNIDPEDPVGQFADKGPQYHTAVFYHSEAQHKEAEEFFKQLIASKTIKGDIYTQIEPYTAFYPAEEYHQEYYQKNPLRYNAYKYGSGRPARLEKVWGKSDDSH